MAQLTNSSSLLNLEGLKDMEPANIAVVYTEWNDKIITELRAGVQRVCAQFKVDIVQEVVVPGCFEIPFGCRMVSDKERDIFDIYPDAIIALGAVIRGGTPHFEYVCKAVTEGITQLNITLQIPVIYGILTLDTEEQAWERLGGAHGHKGEEAAITALKMIQQARIHK
jgi:6,7-dimethyl-8-ribityllumazine synthase